MLTLPMEWTDADECLSRWLVELPDAEARHGLDEGAHAAFICALSSDRRALREASRRSTALPRLLTMMDRGIVEPAELFYDLTLLLQVLDDVVAGAAAHRAGVDWLGHLVQASTFTNLPQLTGGLASLYLKLVGADGLEELWANHGDRGEQPAFVRRRIAEAAFADISVCDTGWCPPPMTGWRLEEEPRVWRWMGVPLHGEQVWDAAWQVAVRDGGPPLVCRGEVSIGYQLLAVRNVNPGGFEALEVLSDQLVAVERDATSDTGWRVSSR